MATLIRSATRIAAGLRDKWVLIEQQSAEPEGGGYPVATWTALGYAWMSRQDLRADERFTANQESAYAEAQWELLYRSDMDPEAIDVPATRRLSYRGRIYNILTATLKDRRTGIELVTLGKTG